MLRAAIPTAEAKLAAFASLVDVDTAPNMIVRKTALGFQHVIDPAPLEATVERYFDSVATIWAERSYHIADTVISGLYPAPLASEALRERTEAWLAANAEAPAALRRIVIESLAGVERALLAQERDRRG